MGRKFRSLTLKHFLPAKEGHGHFTVCRHCWEGEGKEDQLPDTIDDETAKKLPGVIQYKDKDGNTGSLGKHYSWMLGCGKSTVSQPSFEQPSVSHSGHKRRALQTLHILQFREASLILFSSLS